MTVLSKDEFIEIVGFAVDSILENEQYFLISILLPETVISELLWRKASLKSSQNGRISKRAMLEPF